MGLLKYDEMDSEDSRSVHRYWTWGSCIPHVTPPHAQRNPQSPSVRSSLWLFSSQECSEFTNPVTKKLKMLINCNIAYVRCVAN